MSILDKLDKIKLFDICEGRGDYDLPAEQMYIKVKSSTKPENIENKLRVQLSHAKKANNVQKYNEILKALDIYKSEELKMKGGKIQSQEEKKAEKNYSISKGMNTQKEKIKKIELDPLSPEGMLNKMIESGKSPKEAIKAFDVWLKNNTNNELYGKVKAAKEYTISKLEDVYANLDKKNPKVKFSTSNKIMNGTDIANELGISKVAVSKLTTNALQKIYSKLSKKNPDITPFQLVSIMGNFFNISPSEMTKFHRMLPKEVQSKLVGNLKESYLELEDEILTEEVELILNEK